jgi:hypothetical protein
MMKKIESNGEIQSPKVDKYLYDNLGWPPWWKRCVYMKEVYIQSDLPTTILLVLYYKTDHAYSNKVPN